MTEYRYDGTTPRAYPFLPHPERDGVLTVEPDEIVDFGDRLPPYDGLWAVETDGQWILWKPPEEPDEVVAKAAETGGTDPGTGAPSVAETNLE